MLQLHRVSNGPDIFRPFLPFFPHRYLVFVWLFSMFLLSLSALRCSRQKNPSNWPTSCGLGALSCHSWRCWPKQATFVTLHIAKPKQWLLSLEITRPEDQIECPSGAVDLIVFRLVEFDGSRMTDLLQEYAPSPITHQSWALLFAGLIFNLINNLFATCECLVCS